MLYQGRSCKLCSICTCFFLEKLYVWSMIKTELHGMTCKRQVLCTKLIWFEPDTVSCDIPISDPHTNIKQASGLHDAQKQLQLNELDRPGH